MAKKGQIYSGEERELIKRRGQELGGQDKKVPWRKVARELKKELNISRTPGAVRAEFYRMLSRDKIGSSADFLVERFRRSFERMLKVISRRFQECAKLKEASAELVRELQALRKETKPMRLVYQSVLRAQKRAQGRTVEHSQE